VSSPKEGFLPFGQALLASISSGIDVTPITGQMGRMMTLCELKVRFSQFKEVLTACNDLFLNITPRNGNSRNQLLYFTSNKY
jgi:hypothetical protein